MKPLNDTDRERDDGTRMRSVAMAVISMLLLSSLTGCVLVNQEKSIAGDMVGDLPETWTGGHREIPGGAITGWLSDFQSPELTKLVHEAVERNYDLAATYARVEQAQERARIAGSDRVPSLDSGIQTTRSQNLRGASFQSVRANSFNFSLDVSWEVDLWGRVKNLRDSQWDLVTAQSNLYEASRLSLAANVAKTAFEILESQAQIRLTRRNISSLRTNLDILDSKLEAGDADDGTALEISLSRADIARADSNLLAEQQQEDAARRTLETLLGRYPAGSIKALGSLPRPSREVPVGLPSDLLLRRPDLLEAEARVDSSLKELAASRKALLPAVAITGGAGTSTTDEFSDIFDIQNLVWNLGQNLTRPIYQGGRLKANIRLDESEKDELISSYAETALTAFREVETALAAENYLLGQVNALAQASEESRLAEGLSRSQYEQGLVDIITLLESQRRSFDAQSSLLAVKLELLRNRVDLYLALGGDFDHPLIEK
ncbi:MAG: efflux transporter outer membrane subunit [Verrucomicrobiales bacterium]|nr:efflux transporter outer membrane subunit [Verrucomicrobiales bacterium]